MPIDYSMKGVGRTERFKATVHRYAIDPIDLAGAVHVTFWFQGASQVDQLPNDPPEQTRKNTGF